MEPKEFVKDNLCVVCGSPYVHMHHVFPGSRRSNSDKYGFVVPLCGMHHTGRDGVHMNPNKGIDLELKQDCQRRFEEFYGDREKFIHLFGRSYL